MTQMRLCRFCGVLSEVLHRVQMLHKESCHLRCGHHVIYNAAPMQPEGGSMIGSTPYQRHCAVCDASFTSYNSAEDAYAKVCYPCRHEQKVNTTKDAEELIDVLDHYTHAERHKFKTDLWKERDAKDKTQRRSLLQHAPPPVDQEKVAAAIRGMIQYGVLAHNLATIDQPTAYVIAKNGLFHVSHSDIADIVSVPKEVAGVDVEMHAGMTLKIPHIPFALLSQIIAFFRAVEKKSGSEALVQVWWHCQEQRHELHVPDQHVSGGSVQHRSTFDQEQARTAEGAAVWVHVMDIHSHNTMSAFWSSVDDADERKAPEGRMFGVVGKLTQTIPEWKWRIRTRDGFLELQLGDIFEIDPKAIVEFNVSWSVILSSLSTDTGNKDGQLLLRCPVDIFKDATFPEAWMGQLSGHHHGKGHGSVGHGSHGYGGLESSAPIPSYIYIKSADGKKLEEYQMEDGVPTPTGKHMEIVKGGRYGVN